MRNAILGTIAGLLVGMVGALAYSHFMGDGALLADMQAKLDQANADLADAKKAKSTLAHESSGVSNEVEDLQKANDALKQQLADAQTGSATPAASSTINPMTLAGMMGGMMRGQFQSSQRMFLLKTRLKLTPDQEAAVKAAMDADGKARRDFMQQMFRNGGKLPDTAGSTTSYNSLDKTLQSVLSPQQYTQYQQVQADEKASHAEAAATMQVDNLAPLLQFSDSQKEQLVNSLYQVQTASADPSTLIGNPNAMQTLTAQAQATQDAMAKVLTPDQQALYQQAGAAAPQFGMGGFGGRRGGNGGNGGGNGGGGTATTAASGAAVTGYTFAGQTGTAATTTTGTTTSAVTTDTGTTTGTTTTGTTTNAAPTQ